jgi:hypothetical protein
MTISSSRSHQSRKPMLNFHGAAWSLTIAVLPLLVPVPAHAALPELRIAPLEYRQHLDLGRLKTGVIDASNPTGSSMHVQVQVQAFRQLNDRGELQYYDDGRITSAITPAASGFDIGPREAVRTKFTIDPNKLGDGGAYAVIFLRTSDDQTAPGQISTSARVGTLLVLDVGSGGTHTGRLNLDGLPALHLGGSSLPLGYSYANTGHGSKALAFAPQITASTTWSPPRKLTGPFVFPGRTRHQSANLPLANQLGPVQIRLTDGSGGSPATSRWVFVVTGIWIWLLPIIVILLISLILVALRKKVGLPFSTNYHVGK